MKRLFLVGVLLFLIVFPSAAQRKGQIETGGYLFFQASSDVQKKNHSQLFLQNWLGYQLHRNVGLDLEPGVNIDIRPDSINVTLVLMASLRFRLLNVAPNIQRREDYWRLEMDASSVYASLGLGFWSDGYTLPDGTSINHSGPAFMVGIGTQSRFSRYAILRIKVQFMNMIAAEQEKLYSRSAFMVGFGFGTFIRG